MPMNVPFMVYFASIRMTLNSYIPNKNGNPRQNLPERIFLMSIDYHGFRKKTNKFFINCYCCLQSGSLKRNSELQKKYV